ncbi:MAG: hypothetical protein LBR07_10320, partial [Puniceicoccales bacterium]|nr:hypothetical protein [Puniceicoccales bacterium]
VTAGTVTLDGAFSVTVTPNTATLVTAPAGYAGHPAAPTLAVNALTINTGALFLDAGTTLKVIEGTAANNTATVAIGSASAAAGTLRLTTGTALDAASTITGIAVTLDQGALEVIRSGAITTALIGNDVTYAFTENGGYLRAESGVTATIAGVIADATPAGTLGKLTIGGDTFTNHDLDGLGTGATERGFNGKIILTANNTFQGDLVIKGDNLTDPYTSGTRGTGATLQVGGDSSHKGSLGMNSTGTAATYTGAVTIEENATLIFNQDAVELPSGLQTLTGNVNALDTNGDTNGVAEAITLTGAIIKHLDATLTFTGSVAAQSFLADGGITNFNNTALDDDTDKNYAANFNAVTVSTLASAANPTVVNFTGTATGGAWLNLDTYTPTGGSLRQPTVNVTNAIINFGGDGTDGLGTGPSTTTIGANANATVTLTNATLNFFGEHGTNGLFLYDAAAGASDTGSTIAATNAVINTVSDGTDAGYLVFAQTIKNTAADVAGKPTFIKTGDADSILVLTGTAANTYTQGTTLNAGYLFLAKEGALGAVASSDDYASNVVTVTAGSGELVGIIADNTTAAGSLDATKHTRSLDNKIVSDAAGDRTILISTGESNYLYAGNGQNITFTLSGGVFAAHDGTVTATDLQLIGGEGATGGGLVFTGSSNNSLFAVQAYNDHTFDVFAAGNVFFNATVSNAVGTFLASELQTGTTAYALSLVQFTNARNYQHTIGELTVHGADFRLAHATTGNTGDATVIANTDTNAAKFGLSSGARSNDLPTYLTGAGTLAATNVTNGFLFSGDYANDPANASVIVSPDSGVDLTSTADGTTPSLATKAAAAYQTAYDAYLASNPSDPAGAVAAGNIAKDALLTGTLNINGNVTFKGVRFEADLLDATVGGYTWPTGNEGTAPDYLNLGTGAGSTNAKWDQVVVGNGGQVTFDKGTNAGVHFALNVDNWTATHTDPHQYLLLDTSKEILTTQSPQTVLWKDVNVDANGNVQNPAGLIDIWFDTLHGAELRIIRPDTNTLTLTVNGTAPTDPRQAAYLVVTDDPATRGANIGVILTSRNYVIDWTNNGA